MKTTWYLAGILILGLVAVSPAELIHQWKFDGNALDSVGTNHGVVYGATDATGVLGGALKFDGSNDYVALPQLAVTTQQFTVTAWANHLGKGGGSDQVNVIFSQRDDSTGSGKCALTLATESDVLSPDPYAAAVIRSSGSSVQEITSARQPYNQWHHYAMTLSGTTFDFYIDGINVGSLPNLQFGNFTTSIDYINIGRERWSGIDRRFFNGLIDDVRVYDTALSAAEVGALVPEPATLMLVGLGGLALFRKR